MAQDRHLLVDIRLALRQAKFRPCYQVATAGRRIPQKPGLYQDLDTVSGKDNLAQAIIMRLLTPQGELADLGHPEYGSRLHELIGTQNTASSRNLARLYIMESLQREPRIEKVLEVTVAPNASVRELINVRIRVKPVEGTEALTIGPFALELG